MATKETVCHRGLGRERGGLPREIANVSVCLQFLVSGAAFLHVYIGNRSAVLWTLKFYVMKLLLSKVT